MARFSSSWELLVRCQNAIINCSIRQHNLKETGQKQMDKQEILERCKALQLMQSRIPALDALKAFVPQGQEKDPVVEAASKLKGSARWFPADGGHKVLIPFEGQEYDKTRFVVEKGAWDHEHCKACGANIESMTICWITEPDSPFIILCSPCHNELQK
jgi:hypothetical protein